MRNRKNSKNRKNVVIIIRKKNGGKKLTDPITEGDHYTDIFQEGLVDILPLITNILVNEVFGVTARRQTEAW